MFLSIENSNAQRLFISKYDTYDYYNMGRANVTNYNVVSFHNNSPTNKTFEITINRLVPKTKYNIAIKTYFFNNNVIFNHSFRADSSGRIDTANINSSNLAHTGVFQVELRDSVNNILTNFPNQYLVLEKTKEVVIAGSAYNFLIHYAEDFFSLRAGGIMPTFLQNTEGALTNTWAKEITEWHLCDGLKNNSPLNADSTYDIYVHCAIDIDPLVFAFHQGNTLRSEPQDSIRAIYIDSKLQDFFHNPASITEEELLYAVISHEFFHGVQWSFISYKNLKLRFGKNYSNEKEKRDWLGEGQAKFLETVFMKNYSSLSANVTYSSASVKYSYQYYAEDLLESIFGQNYISQSYNVISYDYAMFWRHLYEHNYTSAITDVNRMAFLHETAKIDTTSNLTYIKAFMNGALAAAHGKFANMDSVLKDFAEKTYFHDTLYHNWDDPNHNNFYTAISRSYAEPAAVAYNGTTIENSYKIAASFAFRPHKYSFSAKSAFTLTFTNNAGPNFYVKTYLLDGKKIVSSKEITVTGGTGSTEFCVDTTSKQLVVLVTRTDPNEGGDSIYKIKLTPLPLTFSGMAANTGLPFNVNFTNTSTSNVLGYQWNFGDSTQSADKNPAHSYGTSGVFPVKLSYASCPKGPSLVKANYISLLPFIKKVEIYKSTDTTLKAEFSRTLTAGIFTFSDNAVPLDSGFDLKVRITTSGPLNKMQMIIKDANKVVKFNSTIIKPLPINNKIWEFIVTNGSLASKLNLISFNSSDTGRNELLMLEKPDAYPYKLAEGAGNWIPAIAGLTGTDQNYYLYLKASGNNKKEIEYFKLDACKNYKVLFVNNSNFNYQIDLGDGVVNANFKPCSQLVHYYTTNGPYAVKLIRNYPTVNQVTETFNIQL